VGFGFCNCCQEGELRQFWAAKRSVRVGKDGQVIGGRFRGWTGGSG